MQKYRYRQFDIYELIICICRHLELGHVECQNEVEDLSFGIGDALDSWWKLMSFLKIPSSGVTQVTK